MASVYRFGRIGRFDYLTMIYKLALAPIAPDSCHLEGSATGPRFGAKLLIAGSPNAPTPVSVLEARLQSLCEALQVSPDILEDALCNWQKSPGRYVYFAG